MHLLVRRFSAREVTGHDRSAVFGGHGKNRKISIGAWSVGIRRVLDFGAVQAATALDGVSDISTRETDLAA